MFDNTIAWVWADRTRRQSCWVFDTLVHFLHNSCITQWRVVKKKRPSNTQNSPTLFWVAASLTVHASSVS